MTRIREVVLVVGVALLVAACGGASQPTQSVSDPALSSPFPPVDVSCQSATDCVIKDVGNCCGYYPRCVNAAFPADPAGVRRICEEQGLASVCGFPTITACDCVQGACVGL